jgi:hypothetical protein
MLLISEVEQCPSLSAPSLYREFLSHLYSYFNKGPTIVILPREAVHAARKAELDMLLKKCNNLTRNTAIQ